MCKSRVRHLADNIRNLLLHINRITLRSNSVMSSRNQIIIRGQGKMQTIPHDMTCAFKQFLLFSIFFRTAEHICSLQFTSCSIDVCLLLPGTQCYQLCFLQPLLEATGRMVAKLTHQCCTLQSGALQTETEKKTQD